MARTEPAEAALGRLMPSVVELLAGDPVSLRFAESTVIYDHADPTPLPRHCVVLGVGIGEEAALLEAIERSAAAAAAALVLRVGGPLAARVTDAADRAGIALLGLAGAVSWDQADALLRSSLFARRRPLDVARDSVGAPSGDLFSLADAICALIDAPVTIEDREQRVLAYSDRQDEVDQTRVVTILGRRVPERVRRIEESLGFVERLRTAQRPVFLDLGERAGPRARPRVALPVRIGSEVVGTIWGVVDEPLSLEREELLIQAAKLVAVQIVQQEYRFDPHEQLVRDLLDAALHRGPTSRRAAEQLNLDASTCVALVVDEIDSGGRERDPLSSSRSGLDQRRRADALAVHLGALHSGTVVAVLRGRIHAVVPIGSEAGAERALAEECERFVDRACPRDETVVGIGGVANDIDGLARSREEAEDAVRALRAGRLSRRAVLVRDVEPESWLLEMREMLRASGRGPGGAYTRLREYDRVKGTELLQTLRCWLDAHGDVAVAASSMYVHQNTFRYRLRRAAEIGGIDLGDARERFHLELQLRLFGNK